MGESDGQVRALARRARGEARGLWRWSEAAAEARAALDEKQRKLAAQEPPAWPAAWPEAMEPPGSAQRAAHMLDVVAVWRRERCRSHADLDARTHARVRSDSRASSCGFLIYPRIILCHTHHVASARADHDADELRTTNARVKSQRGTSGLRMQHSAGVVDQERESARLHRNHVVLGHSVAQRVYQSLLRRPLCARNAHALADLIEPVELEGQGGELLDREREDLPQVTCARALEPCDALLVVLQIDGTVVPVQLEEVTQSLAARETDGRDLQRGVIMDLNDARGGGLAEEVVQPEGACRRVALRRTGGVQNLKHGWECIGWSCFTSTTSVTCRAPDASAHSTTREGSHGPSCHPAAESARPATRLSTYGRPSLNMLVSKSTRYTLVVAMDMRRVRGEALRLEFRAWGSPAQIATKGIHTARDRSGKNSL